MQIAHESVLSIVNTVSGLTDYDYLLVHLLDESEEYARWALNSTRMTILDNSIFELGTPHDWDRYRHWIEKLEPTYAVLPDALDDAETTLANLDAWFTHRRYPKWTKYMAVVQGRSLDEVLECYRAYVADSRIDLIGISFDSEAFNTMIEPEGLTQDEVFMMGRIALIKMLTQEGSAVTPKPLHLLGCALPHELQHYRGNASIASIDTSSPVVHGLAGIRFGPEPLREKVKTKLYTLLDAEVRVKQFYNVVHNIETFRKYVK